MTRELGRWRATYTPGAWLLLCGPAAAVVLEPADPSWSDLVETLWDEVVSAESIGELAARLAWYRIDAMPSFAAFFWGPDGMRSLVRGDVAVVDAVSGETVATGEGVQTWVEAGLAGLSQVRVELPTARPDGAFPLPLVVGAVGVSSVFLDASDEAHVSFPQEQESSSDRDVTSEDAVPPQPEPVTEGESRADERVGQESLPDDALPDDALADDVTARTEHENAATRWVPIAELGLDEPPSPGGPGSAPGPTVEAVFCGWGHPNPPGSRRCRVCDALVSSESPRTIPAPVLATLRPTGGDSVPLVSSALVGRAPAADRARTDDPALLTLTSPTHDISRTHVEVFAAGWQVCVTDLHSTNGTVLRFPDQTQRTMEAGETSTVVLGTSLELADGISVLIDFPQ